MIATLAKLRLTRVDFISILAVMILAGPIGMLISYHRSIIWQSSQTYRALGAYPTLSTYVLLKGDEIDPSLADCDVYITLPDTFGSPMWRAYDVFINLNPNKAKRSISTYIRVESEELPPWVLSEFHKILRWRSQLVTSGSVSNPICIPIESLEAKILAHGRPHPTTVGAFGFLTDPAQSPPVFFHQHETLMQTWPSMQKLFGGSVPSITTTPLWSGMFRNSITLVITTGICMFLTIILMCLTKSDSAANTAHRSPTDPPPPSATPTAPPPRP